MENKVLVKRSCPVDLDDEEDEVFYEFKVLLPNGISVMFKLDDPGAQMLLQDFLNKLKNQYFQMVKYDKPRRSILWESANLYVEDEDGNKLPKKINFRCFVPRQCQILTLHDGEKETGIYENMWDLTPDPEMLKNLPEEYSFETALADLIDNSLQAVWSNGPKERRLVCVTISEHKISIFDSGPGMDASDKNSIVKWGKIGASLHRAAKRQAIGGTPPYLIPFFGMYGYGGIYASMNLGSYCLVSSMRKESKKVYTLRLERKALVSRSGEETWKTDGGIRDPLEEEISSSPHGSFTKVEIFDPKERRLDKCIFQLQCKLKDIYFPYIQCDEMLATGKTRRPVEFQVNSEDLAEIEGGEIAITNLLSCNGPEFVLQLLFLINKDAATTRSPGLKGIQEANARLKFVYFPIVEGVESFEKILERINAEEFGNPETFDTFSRVSIRRLGRLLPDARWGKLPFMEPKSRKGDRAQVLKRCCMRVKCFVETDAGFIPTPYKTDLAHKHAYTIALKNFGDKLHGKESDVRIEIFRDGKLLSLSQTEKEYEDWVFQMHDGYDEEVVCGEDQPVIILNPQNKKALGISSDVLRVHKVLRRRGATWKSGQHIKIFKGAVGCHKNNCYATVEYILIEGFQGEVGGEARLICRPIDVPQKNGCMIKLKSEIASINLQDSLSFPISVIDLEKCKLMEPSEWKQQLQKRQQKSPSMIDVLSAQDCQQLKIDGALPIDLPVCAGHATPEKIVAVIRPFLYDSSSSCNSLDKKYIVKDDMDMSLEVSYTDNDHRKVKHQYGERTKPSSHEGISGLYVFSLGLKMLELFRSAGIYTFTFTAICKGSSSISCVKRVTVKPSTEVGKWELLHDEKNPSYHVRVGQNFPHLFIACFDIYENRMQFISTPEVMIKLTQGSKLFHSKKMKVDISSDKMTLGILDICIESCCLDDIRPNYKATLEIYSEDELFNVHVPCLVTPGPLCHIKALHMVLKKCLLPGDVIEDLILEMLDCYGNHVKEGLVVSVDLHGFCFEDHNGSKREVDDRGYIDLSGLLKVKASYGKIASFSVKFDGEEYFRKEFEVEKRMLRIVSMVPDDCLAGSQLENVIFEIVNSGGAVDETIHNDVKTGASHTLRITSESSKIDDRFKHNFCRGKCIVSSIPIPPEEGIFSFVAAYSNHPDVCMDIKLSVRRPVELQKASDDHEDSLSSLVSSKRMFRPSKMEMISGNDYEDLVCSQQSNGGTMLLQDLCVCVPKCVQELMESVVNDDKELVDEVEKFGKQIAEQEERLKILQNKRLAIEQGICDLAAWVEPQSLALLDESDVVLERIEGKTDTAASIFCRTLKVADPEEVEKCMRGYIGIVALVGTVHNDKLSRMFAQYLTEDQMLAVVYQSYVDANFLERYGEHGEVDRGIALHGLATRLGKPITGRFLVICLEEIRHYEGEIEGNDPQRKLALPHPVLPTGKVLPGFLGYAVNMINLDTQYLGTRTAKGCGLRETLFYHLFGELHVYATREHMKKACSYIKQGAISLDGGIIKGNGVLSFGYWEPEVRFPVSSPEIQRLSPSAKSDLRQISLKRLELGSISDAILEEKRVHSNALKRFHEKMDRYKKFMNKKLPMVSNLCLEYGQSKDKNLESPF